MTQISSSPKKGERGLIDGYAARFIGYVDFSTVDEDSIPYTFHLGVWAQKYVHVDLDQIKALLEEHCKVFPWKVEYFSATNVFVRSFAHPLRGHEEGSFFVVV